MTVARVYVAADSSVDGQNALFVGGTSGDDTVVVQRGTTTAYIDVVVNGEVHGQFPVTAGGVPIGRIIIYGGAGNDTIAANGSRDILIGGGGTDTLNSGKDDDLLIGSIYLYSDDLDVVRALMADWKSSASYDTRLADIRAGGADGLYALATATVTDAGVVDYLNGRQGRDWFWAFLLDQDDQHGNETNQ